MSRAVRGRMIAIVLSLTVCAPLLGATDASARASGPASSGSRGARSASPAAPKPSRPALPADGARASVSASSGARSGLSGLVGRLFLGQSGSAIGVGDVTLLGVLALFAAKFVRARLAQPLTARRVADADDGAVLSEGGRPATTDGNAPDTAAFAEIFVKVQAAWSARQLGPVISLVTPEMLSALRAQCDSARSDEHVSRVDDIALLGTQVVEVWQETGMDCATVRMDARMRDTEGAARPGDTIDGGASQPVDFTEFWTFTRPVWAKAWRLSAIQQPAPAAM